MTTFHRIYIWCGLGLFLFTAARLALWALHREQFAELSDPELALAFLSGVRFDLASLMVFGGVPMLLMALPFRWLQNRIWVGLHLLLLYALLTLFALVLTGDVLYFGHVKRHLTNELLFLEEDISYLFREALGYWKEALVCLVLISALIQTWWAQAKARVLPAKRPWATWVALFLAIGILGRGGVGMKPLAIVNAYSGGSTAQGNLTLNGVFSASHSSLVTAPVERQSLSKEEIQQALKLPPDFLEAAYPLERSSREELPFRFRNLIIVMVESLTPKYLDAFDGENLRLTPHLDQLAESGWKFTNFYAHGQRSVEGFQSILTGLPSLLGAPGVMDLNSGYSRLASLARQNGYQTLFVNTTDRQAFLTDAFAATVGFEEYYGREDMPLLLDYPSAEQNRRLGWDYEALMFTLKKLESPTPPFLAFISANTAHTPYPRLPERFERFDPHPNEEGGYLNALHYSDWAIGEFFQQAAKQSWFAETLFVITADHVIAHFQSGNQLPERFRVPLILYAPGTLEPREVSGLGSHLDLPATFVDALGLKGDFSSLGTSLLQEASPFVLVREGSVMGLINEQGYLRHSLMQRLEAVDLTQGSAPPDFDLMERQLLAWDRLAYDLIRSNRWSR